MGNKYEAKETLNQIENDCIENSEFHILDSEVKMSFLLNLGELRIIEEMIKSSIYSLQLVLKSSEGNGDLRM